MSDAMLERILTEVVALKAGQDALKAEVAALKTGQEALKTGQDALKVEVTALKTEVASLKAGQQEMKAGQQEMLTAFRDHWSDMSNLYRTVREEVRRFEDAMADKLAKYPQEIAGLRAMIEMQDQQNRDLASRVPAWKPRLASDFPA
jgi:chromosome segregation ATPase